MAKSIKSMANIITISKIFTKFWKFFVFLVGSPTPPPETQTQTGDATPEPAPVTTYYISPTPPLTPHLTADQFGRSVHSELSQWFSFAIAILALTGCLMTIALMANKPVKGI